VIGFIHSRTPPGRIQRAPDHLSKSSCLLARVAADSAAGSANGMGSFANTATVRPKPPTHTLIPEEVSASLDRFDALDHPTLTGCAPTPLRRGHGTQQREYQRSDGATECTQHPISLTLYGHAQLPHHVSGNVTLQKQAQASPLQPMYRVHLFLQVAMQLNWAHVMSKSPHI
jgi:hypothetical protein